MLDESRVAGLPTIELRNKSQDTLSAKQQRRICHTKGKRPTHMQLDRTTSAYRTLNSLNPDILTLKARMEAAHTHTHKHTHKPSEHSAYPSSLRCHTMLKEATSLRRFCASRLPLPPGLLQLAALLELLLPAALPLLRAA